MMNTLTIASGIIVEESAVFTLNELSDACGKPAKWILALVDEGIIEPVGSDLKDWKFSGHCLRRARIVQHLEADLRVNLAGAALAVELLEELEALRNRIAVLER